MLRIKGMQSLLWTVTNFLFRTKSKRRFGGIGTHVYVFLARKSTVARLESRHVKRALPEDR